MDFFSISALINVATSGVIGPLVLLSNPRGRVQQLFFLFATAVATWSIFYFFWRLAATPTEAVYWTQWFMAGAILIPFFYFHFILYFLNVTRKYRILVWFGYLSAAFFLLLNSLFTSYFIGGVEMKTDAVFWPNAGPLFTPFLVIWGLYALLPVSLLLKRYTRENQQDMKKSVAYILVGTLIGYAGGATNYILWYDIPIQPWGNITATFYIGTVAYAITRFRLFDMRVVAAQMITFGLWLLLFVRFLLAETLRDQVLNFATLGFAMVIGVFLIRAVDREVQQRELIEKQNKALQLASEEKSEFMTFASHEIRNPMTAVRGYASLILDGSLGEVKPEVKDAARKIFVTGGQVLNLIAQFLDRSKIELGQLHYEAQPFDIGTATKDVASGFEVYAEEKGLELKTDVPDEKITVCGDEGKLRGVIGNLIDNSLKYTKEGSVTVSVQKKGDWVQVRVKDTGAGIPAQTLLHLFRKFSRADAKKLNLMGTGIGLYLAKEFIEAHDGRIWAESEGEGKGSTFIIELPLGN